LGCENTGPNPTDRAKKGTKRHLLTEGNGMPLALVVTGANRNDFKETKSVIKNIVVKRPRVSKRKKQHLCLDKAKILGHKNELPQKETLNGEFATLWRIFCVPEYKYTLGLLLKFIIFQTRSLWYGLCKIARQLKAYPKTPAARKEIKAHARYKKVS
jgi:hypothetical protein